MNLQMRFKFLKTLLFQLIASFLSIILMLSIFNYISYNYLITNMENEMINNTDERFGFFAQKLDEKLLEARKMMLKITFNDRIPSISSGQYLDPYLRKVLVDYLISTETAGELKEAYINNLFIMLAELNDLVIVSDGIYHKQRYFTAFFRSPVFTEDFWLSEMKKEFTFKYYASGSFIDNSLDSAEKQKKSYLLPIAFKNKLNDNFIMVALIDIEALLSSIDIRFFTDLYIYDSDGNEIYPFTDSEPHHKIDVSASPSFRKSKEGYIFTMLAPNTGLTYQSFLSNSVIAAQLARINAIYRWIVVLSLLLSILLSIYIARRFTNPVKQIVETIEKTFDSHHESKGHISNLLILKEDIQKIVTQNRLYEKNLSVKDSMLESFTFNARLRNIYINIKDQLLVRHNYRIVLFNIHCKPGFHSMVPLNISEATFCLTELIQLYLSTCFSDAISFQAENDQIVSIINYQDSSHTFNQEILGIVEKLKSEEDYVYFTVVVSEVLDDITELHNNYAKILENVNFRLLTPQTQILFEDQVKDHLMKFFFSQSQAEQLTNQLSNGNRQESIRFANEILDNNYRKNVCALYIRLLFIEIVNCGMKVLQKKFVDVPKEIDFNSLYHAANKLATIEAYKELCGDFIASVTDYIGSHEKGSDYILDFIVNYVENHYSQDIYVELLAERLNRTSNYISFYFKDKYGTNLNDYINNFRIKKAQELLEGSSMKIKDISTKVGFSNVNTFIRLFKKYTGKTSDEYRRDLSANK